MVDPAILRPGRFDKILFIDFPNADERADILIKATKVISVSVHNVLILINRLESDESKNRCQCKLRRASEKFQFGLFHVMLHPKESLNPILMQLF